MQLDRLHLEHPGEPLYLYWLARIDYDQRRYEEAVAKYRSVIQQRPDFSRAYDGLGLTLDMLGRLTEAREVLTTAVALNRNAAQPSAWPPENLGYLLLRLGELEKAEAALREALRYDPRLAICHYHLARVLEKEHLEPAAIEEYRAASSLDSSFAEPCYALGLLYRRLHRPEDASAAMAEFRRRKSTP
ncbi:MAG TPA: tetratricopeptide repeat protein [Bryobacteraceae bacterium]|nr:tetratricopeptide repeat protein [Bryobacteraceae bacterium]